MPESLGIETLLEHAAFLRRIALQLAGPGHADDVVQETLVRAVQASPEARRNARGWLRTVMTNVWHNRRREAARRAQREAVVGSAACAADTVPAVDEIVAREELRRRVVAAVIGLPEPLRDVVLLRFYEGLESPAIGQRLGRPASTVRSQLQQACERLRAQLDEQHGGQRAAWAVPMLVWARPEAGGPPMPMPMARPRLGRLSGVAAGVMAVVGVLAWAFRQPESVPATVARVDAAATAAAAATANREVRNERLPASTTEVAGESGTGGLAGQDITGGLRVTVIDDVTAQAVAGAALRVESVRRRGSVLASLPVASDRQFTTTTDDEGLASLIPLPVGAYAVEATMPDGRRAWRQVAIGTEERAIELALTRRPFAGVVAVKVVDRNGLAVADAAVQVACTCTRRGLVGSAAQPPIEGRTDASGLFLLRDSARVEFVAEGVVVARTTDGRSGSLVIGRGEHRGDNPWFEVIVDAPGAIRGRLRGPHSDWTGVTVTALATWIYDGVQPDCTVGAFALRVAADGSFAGDALPAGRYHLAVAGVNGLVDRAGAAVDSWQSMPVTKVVAGVTAEPELVLEAVPVVRGVVVGEAGVPLSGVAVTALRVAADARNVLWHPLAEDPPSPATMLVAATDAAGRYELALRPGRWLITATARGRTLDVQPIVVPATAPWPELSHRLVADGALRGRCWRSSVVALRPVAGGGEALVQLVETTDGAFGLRGLLPGVWEVGHFDEGFEPLGRVDIVAGRTSWFDGAARVVTVRGSVHHDGRPLAGIGVDAGDREEAVRTDESGTFVVSVPAWPADRTLHFTHRGLAIGHQPCGPATELGAIELSLRTLDLECTDAHGAACAFLVELTELSVDRDRRARYAVPTGRIEDQWLEQDRLYLVDVRTSSGGRVQQHLAAGKGPVRLRCDSLDASAFAVRLVDAHGAPRIGAAMQAVAWGQRTPAPQDGASFWRGRSTATFWAAHFPVHATTDADGIAHFDGVPTGPVLVWFAGEWGRYGYDVDEWNKPKPPPVEHVFTLQPGDNSRRIELALPR